MTAKEYIKQGFSIIPVKEDKSPDISNWKIYQSEIIDEKLIKNNIGVVGGKISNNLEILDFDNHGGTAKENLKEYLSIPLVKEIYEKYKLPVVSTQGGGYHIYYRCEKIEGNQKLAMVLLNGKPDVIIETRGEGGYVVAPPTKGYKLIRNTFDVQEIEIKDRAILLEYAKSLNEYTKPIVENYQTDNNQKPWEIYNNELSSIQESKNLLKKAGWKEQGKKWQRPDKKKGISATFGMVADNIFYVFSSNAFPFENDTAYTPFAIKSILEYNSDFKKCARDLSEKYGLNRKKKKETKKPFVKIDTNELDNILNDALIDLDKEYIEPPMYLGILDNNNKPVSICTPSNISAITGKAKSKKSFFQSMLVATATSGRPYGNVIVSNLPENKKGILLFDTEQSKFHVYTIANRISRIIGYKPVNLGVFSLRGLGAETIINLLEHTIKKYNGGIGMIFIDQVADLAKSINDEEEAVRIVTLLESLTAKYECHICTVIHQNKKDNYATGWLGSQILKKAESIISVNKVDSDTSKVSPDAMRGKDFTTFLFRINSKAIPEISNTVEFESEL